jgi:hypothetical protein
MKKRVFHEECSHVLNSHRCVLHPGLQDPQRFHLDKQVSRSEYSTIDYGEGDCSSVGAPFGRREFGYPVYKRCCPSKGFSTRRLIYQPWLVLHGSNPTKTELYSDRY